MFDFSAFYFIYLFLLIIYLFYYYFFFFYPWDGTGQEQTAVTIASVQQAAAFSDHNIQYQFRTESGQVCNQWMKMSPPCYWLFRENPDFFQWFIDVSFQYWTENTSVSLFLILHFYCYFKMKSVCATVGAFFPPTMLWLASESWQKDRYILWH